MWQPKCDPQSDDRVRERVMLHNKAANLKPDGKVRPR